jgi:hypothetical protein
MRWKLLVIASLAAAIIGAGLWSALAIGVFGSALALARNDWLLLSSLIIPVAIAVYSGVFVYRHTARRRKTQAMITVILALLFTLGAYFAAAGLVGERLRIPGTYEVRHAR